MLKLEIITDWCIEYFSLKLSSKGGSSLDSLFLSLSIFGLIVSILDALSRKWLATGEYRKISETDGKKVDRWIRGILLLFAFSLLFYIDLNNFDALKGLFIFFSIIGLGFQAVMEWKYLEGKKHVASFLLMVISVLAILGIFHVTYDMKLTSYEDVVSVLIDEEDTIIRMTIEDMETRQRFQTEDPEIIEKLFSIPPGMEMRKMDRHRYIDNYHILFHTDNRNNISFSVGEESLAVFGISDTNYYAITEDNQLYQFIENKDWDWEEY